MHLLSKASRLTRVSIYMLCLLQIVLLSPTLYGQEKPVSPLNEFLSTVNDFAFTNTPEKIYIQTDKPAYNSGDTIWFKGFLLDAAYLHASAKSGVMYIEIANDSNTVVKRVMVPVMSGITFGSIALTDFIQGQYTLKAYTNWMRNFNEHYVFSKSFYINNAGDTDWLVNYQAKLLKNEVKDKMQVKLLVSQFDKVPVGLREMQLRLTNGKRTLSRSEVQTGIDGTLDIALDLPEKADQKNLSLVLQDLRKGQGQRKLNVPIMLNRPEAIDLQFMPEGGTLISGLSSHIAFKAINEDGFGADIMGKILNAKGAEVAAFKSVHKGMGAFDLLPEANEIYTAKVTLPDGSIKAYSLPKVESSGVGLKVVNPYMSDSLTVILGMSPALLNTHAAYYLVGQARGIALFGAAVGFNKPTHTFTIDKKIFPTGVARFTVLTADKRPLCERLVFIDHQDYAKIQVTAQKPFFQQRDSVVIDIKVSDKNGGPLIGSFGVAVTDDGQVKQDKLVNANIISKMLLTCDLNGNIEGPGYYFPEVSNARVAEERDILLLTQGWAGYNWGDIFEAKPFAYEAEPEFVVKGKVTNMFNKPVANSGVMLMSKKPLMITDTVTNEKGIFIFKNIFPADTAAFFIQARNKKGKSFNVGIEVDEFKPPVFTASTDRLMPWNVNIDTNRFQLLTKRLQLKKEQDRLTGGNMLKDVIIKDKKIVKGSKNLNGPGEADLILDEKDMEKAGRTNLGDLLRQRVKGFMRRVSKNGVPYYAINTMAFHLIIDGMDTEFFKSDDTPLYQYFEEYFDYFDAAEIKGIEVMFKGGHQMRYTSEFIKDPMAVPWDHAFVEVTTRSGHGPFIKKTVGTYVYRPMPFSMPKSFYSPKYQAKTIPDGTDIRSTIFWQPNIVTDKDGKATVKFYTTDNPGTYTVIVEGSDLNGNIGFVTQKITVKKQVIN